MKKNELKNIADMLFETGILAKTPRSGFYFLGSGKQSVAEHTNRTAFVGYSLASIIKEADSGKVIKMCLLHDLHEARTSDLNYVHQKYSVTDEERAEKDLSDTLPFGEDMSELLKEYKERRTIESQIAKDADQIELILSLKEQIDLGNERAKIWVESALQRLKTEEAKKLAEVIMETDFDNWWFRDKDDKWWVDRNN